MLAIRSRGLAAALTFISLPSWAWAQDAGPAPDVAADAAPAPAQAEPEPEPALTPEEQAEFDAATAADSQALAESRPAAPGARGAPAAAYLPDLAFVADFAFAWFSADENLQGGGHDPTENGFTLQQLELSLGKSVDPYLRLDGNLVFTPFGVEIEEVFGTTLALPARLQARFGQFLTRFGRANAQHLHASDFVDQPFALSRVFGGEGNRNLGVELSWLSPLPWYVELVGAITDPRGAGTARSFLGDAPVGLEAATDFQLTLAAKQFFELTDSLGLYFGLSYAAGPNATGHDNRSEVYGADLYLRYRPVTRASHTIVVVQTEWLHRRRQVPDDVLADTSGYAYLFWRFAPRWGAAGRWELGTPAIGEAGVHVAGSDTLDPEWIDRRQRASAALTYTPTEFSRFRLQASGDFPAWEADPIWAVVLAAEVVIGAHAAHKY